MQKKEKFPFQREMRGKKFPFCKEIWPKGQSYAIVIFEVLRY